MDKKVKQELEKLQKKIQKMYDDFSEIHGIRIQAGQLPQIWVETDVDFSTASNAVLVKMGIVLEKKAGNIIYHSSILSYDKFAVTYLGDDPLFLDREELDEQIEEGTEDKEFFVMPYVSNDIDDIRKDGIPLEVD